MGVAYYLGSLLGFQLTFQPNPISALWPPNSILLAGLLLVPTAHWPLVLLAAVPAHLASQFQSGVPASMIVGWFVSNCVQALIGAAGIRMLVPGELRFYSLRHVVIFVLVGACASTFLSSFLDAGLVVMLDWGHVAYWDLWVRRTFSNLLATLTIVPVIVCWASRLRMRGVMRSSAFGLEPAMIVAGLVAMSFVAFAGDGPSVSMPILLYAPIPFLLWAAVRLGPRGTSTAFLVVVSLAVWGALNGRGPFLDGSTAQSALAMQLFLSLVAIALLLLSAVIQEREGSAEELREYREQLGLALSAGHIGTWAFDLEGTRANWSQISKAIFGREHRTHSISSDVLTDMAHPQDRYRVREALLLAARNGTPFEMEYRIVKPDGQVRSVVAKGGALRDRDGRPSRMLGVTVDITQLREAEEVRRAQEETRRSESEFHRLADTMPHMVWAATADGIVDYCNQRWFEVSQQPLRGGEDWWLTTLHPADRYLALDVWRECVATGKPFEMECRFLFSAAREYRWQLARAVSVRDEKGVTRWFGSFTDIQDRKAGEQILREMGSVLQDSVDQRTEALHIATHALGQQIAERARAEDALRKLEERFSRALASLGDAALIVRRRDGTIVDVNDRWLAMLEVERASVLGRRPDELDVVESPESKRVLAGAIQSPVPKHGLELKLKRRSGAIVEGLLYVEPFEMAGVESVIVIVRDLTDQRRLENTTREQRNQLTHLTRVAVLGELTGAIAHELNQPLTAILSNAQATQRVLSRKTFDMGEVRESLRDIVEQDKRAGEVIRRMRVLLKKRDPERLPVNMNDVVDHAIELARPDLSNRGVAVTTKLRAKLPRVLGDAIQLQQVLLNLIVNACDEMAANPAADRRIAITTAPVRDSDVQVSISDRGRGISPALIERLFEPFYTTKETGLGLGLSISRSIIEAHGGRLWAESGPEGATFHLRLPVAETRS